VVSKDISVESIEEVSRILRRAPVIWDNIYANDYDQKRLFLGPYKGRSTELIPRLKGVLTNPNCEFESNFVAIHTLATWYKSNMNGVRKDMVMSESRSKDFGLFLFFYREICIARGVSTKTTLLMIIYPKISLGVYKILALQCGYFILRLFIDLTTRKHAKS